MAKTLFLAEGSEDQWLMSVNHYLGAQLPRAYRDFAIAHREEGFSAAYTAHMVMRMQDAITKKSREILERSAGDKEP